jgi:rhodanese-related sulfurtransferase
MKQLSVRELAQRAADAAAAGTALRLLDVREPWERALAALDDLPGVEAVGIPMATLPLRLAELAPTQPVVCLCHHGARSAQVVAFLMRQGWTDVYNLAGGIDAWSLQVDPGVPRY